MATDESLRELLQWLNGLPFPVRWEREGGAVILDASEWLRRVYVMRHEFEKDGDGWNYTPEGQRLCADLDEFARWQYWNRPGIDAEAAEIRAADHANEKQPLRLAA